MTLAMLINQLITLALVEKLSALVTEEYLSARAERGSRKKFERVMAKVPKVKPGASDHLSA